MTKLIIDLNTSSLLAAVKLIAATETVNARYKVGLNLLYTHGVNGLRSLGLSGQSLMLDLKAVDTPYTVSEALKGLFQVLRPNLLTLYPDDSGRHIEAARKVVEEEKVSTRLLQITVLTTTGKASLAKQHKTLAGPAFGTTFMSLESLLVGRACVAKNSGAHGIVCAAQDLPLIDASLRWPDMVSACTGIRPTWAHWVKEGDDQSRPATPEQVKKADADYAIVGRPISAAPHPGRAADSLARELN